MPNAGCKQTWRMTRSNTRPQREQGGLRWNTEHRHLAGLNGAGKSTVAKALLKDTLGIRHFVSADTIAHGLSASNSEEMAVKAAKVMLQHLHDLALLRVNFAFETTLASRTFAPWIAEIEGERISVSPVLPVAAVRRNFDRSCAKARAPGRPWSPGRDDSASLPAWSGELLSPVPPADGQLGDVRERD